VRAGTYDRRRHRSRHLDRRRLRYPRLDRRHRRSRRLFFGCSGWGLDRPDLHHARWLCRRALSRLRPLRQDRLLPRHRRDLLLGHVSTRPLRVADGCLARRDRNGSLGRPRRPGPRLDHVKSRRLCRFGPLDGGLRAGNRRGVGRPLLMSQAPFRCLDLTDPGRVLLRRPVEDNGAGSQRLHRGRPHWLRLPLQPAK
jgi:hypothetical protein